MYIVMNEVVFFINGWVRIQKIVALLFLTKLVLSIYENDICRIVPLLNFLLPTFFGKERKKRKERKKKERRLWEGLHYCRDILVY